MKLNVKQEIIDQLDLDFKKALRHFKSNKNVTDVTKTTNNKLVICSEKFNSIFTKGNPCLYSIFTFENKIWKIKYIGETKKAKAKQRLTNHLIKKHEKTGAKLEKVNESLSKNFKIGVKVIYLNNEALRYYFEEKLIMSIPDLPWNIQGRTNSKPGPILKKVRVKKLIQNNKRKAS